MLETLGDDSQRESLNPCQCNLLGLAVREDTRKIDDFCEPPAVVLLFEFHLVADHRLCLPGDEYTTRLLCLGRMHSLIACNCPDLRSAAEAAGQAGYR